MKKLLLFLSTILILVACSRKNTGVISRSYHNVTSWNNILFNGEMDMDKNLESKKDSYKDDYFTFLKVEPIDYFPSDQEMENAVGDGSIFKNTKSGQNSTEPFDISTFKAEKAIDKHSMKIKGKEYNKMMVRAYNMLGKSRMYQGKYFEAMDAFNYINKNFEKEKYKIDNNIYIAEVQDKLGNSYDAQTLFEELEAKKMTKKQQGLWARKYGQYLMNNGKDSLAFDVLNLAYKRTKNKKLRGRFRYIQAQILEKIGDTEEAKKYYTKAFKKKPGFEMEVKSQMAIASLFDPEKDNLEDTEQQLKKVLKKGTYAKQKNEVYFTLAEMSESVDSVDRAESYYKRALEFPASDTQVRTLTYAHYADLLYDKKEYRKASAYYDSAFITVAKEELKASMESRSKNLKKLVKYYDTVELNDSILALTKMTDKEQRKYFGDYVAKLKEKEAQQKFEESSQFALNKNGDYNFSYEQKGKFYFYNQNLKAKGEIVFKERWGNRGLKDNWRISTGFSSEDEEGDLGNAGIDTNDPRRFDVEYYLSLIPNTPTSIDSLKVQRDSAEVNLAILYLDKFEDAPSSISASQHLIGTPPKNEDINLLAHYYLYKAAENSNPSVAEKAKKFLVENYPTSKYTRYILNPNTDYFTNKSEESVQFYEQTYEAYEKGQYQKVIDNADKAQKQFPKDEIIAKFALLRAYAEGKLGRVDEFKASLERIMIIFEGTPEAQKAETILNDIKDKK